MTWQYRISTGTLKHDGVFEGTGYSGLAGIWRNNPDMQAVVAHGPIPVGSYKIGPAYNHQHLGPCVMNLDPLPETDTHGRSLFRVHGDNARHDASHGCVILGPAIRHVMAQSAGDTLDVVA